MAQQSQKISTSSNFGKMGWFIIVYIGALLFLAGVILGDGFNAILPAFAEEGMDLAGMLAYVTVAQIVSYFVCYFLSVFIVRKFGCRIVSTAALILIGIALFVWGRSTTLSVWTACMIILQILVNLVTANTGMALAASWFPTRKGLALGWATMGSNLGSALCVYMLRFLFDTFDGIAGGFTVIGIVVIIFAVVCFFIYRDAPEQMGLTPDNMPMTEDEIKASRAKFEQTEPVRITWLLRQWNFWVDAIIFGLLGMACAGLVSQFVTGLTQAGIEEERAVFLFAVSAIIAMAMSYLFGWLDVKIGTKLATFWLGLCFAVGALCLVMIPTLEILVYPSLLLIAGGIGGYVNLMPSLCSSIFGRKLFVEAYGAATVVTGCIRATVFSILAWSLSSFGNYMTAYKIIIAVSVIGAFMVFLLKEDKFAINNGQAI